MVTKYTIQMNYNASMVVDVMANDEGEALDKARDIAEEADNRQFQINNEREALILQRE